MKCHESPVVLICYLYLDVCNLTVSTKYFVINHNLAHDLFWEESHSASD